MGETASPNPSDAAVLDQINSQHFACQDSSSSNVVLTGVDESNSTSPSPDPYIRRPAIAYMHYVLPLFTVALFSFVFALYVHAKGEVPVPRWLSNLTTSNPRLTAQIVTIFSSFLAAAIRWALSGSAVLLAKKRILNQSRPILEIEMFSNLKNISVLLDRRHRKGMVLLTWLLVALCGLLTSGFVTLLNPLAVPITTELRGGKELNLASSSGICTSWYSNIKQRLRTSLSCHTVWVYKEFEYSSCSATEIDILDVIKTSLRNRASGDYMNKYSKLVSVYPDLNNTRIIGTTSGALITGPHGVQAFSFPVLSPTLQNYNYTLQLQGVWADVSCSYDKDVTLGIEWGRVHNATELYDAMIEYKATCPGSSPYETGNTTLLSGTSVKLEATLLCPTESGENRFLFRNFTDIQGSSSGTGSDYLSCRFPASLGDVDAILDADLRAFIPVRKGPSIAASSGLAEMVAEEVVRMVLAHFTKPTTRAKLWSERFLAQNTKNGLYDLDIVGSTMQGMFAYEATRLRLMLAAMASSDPAFTLPNECLREVKAVILERTIGWSIQSSTTLGLVPLVIVALITITMSVLAAIAAGRLTVFDPTNPVSLIAATSFGNVVFPRNSNNATHVGSPLDKTVLYTKVSYGEHESGWGLKSRSLKQ